MPPAAIVAGSQVIRGRHLLHFASMGFVFYPSADQAGVLTPSGNRERSPAQMIIGRWRVKAFFRFRGLESPRDPAIFP
jgi:hypothetical protein